MSQNLLSNFAAVQDETEVIGLEIRGSLPPELCGTYYRNGMNRIGATGRSDDWLLGDGMVHAVELAGGRAVSYRNRWVRTDRVCDLLGEPRPENQPARVASHHLSVANTHVIQHGSSLLALFEMCLPTAMTPELRTLGRFDFGGKLQSPMTSHPKVDPATGEMFFFGYSPVGPPWLNVHRVDAAGTLCDSWAVDVPGPTMMHDFAITEHHLLFLDLPVVFDLRSAARRAVPVQWSPSYGARIGVQGRGGGEARWFDIESCYVFHTVNAFEDDAGLICLDVLRYRSIFNRENCDPELYRFTIDLVAGKVVETKVDDLVQEFPRIDDRKTGNRYRFSYSAQTPVRPGPLKPGGIVKNDMIAGNAVVNDLGGNRVPGEPVFVPAGPGEDEGWLMTLAYDPAEDASALVVLDAQDFTAAPVAEVLLPRRVPFGAHGSWVDTADAGVVNRR